MTKQLKCDTLCHMKVITIRELHEKTGHWVRAAGRYQNLVVTDRGRPIATLGPAPVVAAGNPFRQRRVLPAYAAVQAKLSGGTDSALIVTDDRDRT